MWNVKVKVVANFHTSILSGKVTTEKKNPLIWTVKLANIVTSWGISTAFISLPFE